MNEGHHKCIQGRRPSVGGFVDSCETLRLSFSFRMLCYISNWLNLLTTCASSHYFILNRTFIPFRKLAILNQCFLTELLTWDKSKCDWTALWLSSPSLLICHSPRTNISIWAPGPQTKTQIQLSLNPKISPVSFSLSNFHGGKHYCLSCLCFWRLQSDIRERR